MWLAAWQHTLHWATWVDATLGAGLPKGSSDDDVLTAK